MVARDGWARWRGGCGLRCGGTGARLARGGSLPGGRPGRGRRCSTGTWGPWDLLWGSGGPVAGVLGWGLAWPAGSLYDTGHLAWFIVPLMDDVRARARGFPRPPSRLARLDAFARGTRLPVSEVLGAVLQAQREYARRIVATPGGAVGCLPAAGVPRERGG